LWCDGESHVGSRPKHQRMALANGVRHGGLTRSSMILIG
jgi:hypothetical protein